MSEPLTASVAEYLVQLNRVLGTQGARIKGEVTSIGHYPNSIFFTIKDSQADAYLNCVIWPSVYRLNGIDLKEGDEIIITGQPNIYEKKGTLSFVTDTIEYAGEGALKRQYEKLKAALEAEGLFAPEHKRPLPAFPKKIGVITSKHGAVIQDFNTNLGRRGYQITMVDARVEGKDAIHDLVAAIKTMAKREIEVLVVMRGGGSWESLQAFNTESVVRALARFKVPVLTGIGHDSDVTLTQLVADIGRSTPTAVAEALNEPWDGLEDTVRLLERNTIGSYVSWLTAAERQVRDASQQIFRSYERWLAAVAKRVVSLSHQIAGVFGRLAARVRIAEAGLAQAVALSRAALRAHQTYLQRLPAQLSRNVRADLNQVEITLRNGFRRSFQRQAIVIREASQNLSALTKTVNLNDPKRNMRLGYSLSYTGGKLVRNVKDVRPGQTLTTQLADGEFTSEVKRVK
jgi:exodeoxyribonuclease VII large subunit